MMRFVYYIDSSSNPDYICFSFQQRLNAFCFSNGLSFFLEVIVAVLFPVLFQFIHFYGFILICLVMTITNLVVVQNIVPETLGKWLIN